VKNNFFKVTQSMIRVSFCPPHISPCPSICQFNNKEVPSMPTMSANYHGLKRIRNTQLLFLLQIKHHMKLCSSYLVTMTVMNNMIFLNS